MDTTLTDDMLAPIRASLDPKNAAFAHLFAGQGKQSQPVHVLYGGAHLFKADTPAKLGQLARTQLAQIAPDAATLAAIFGLSEGLAALVYPRLLAKLEQAPLEDLRVDFEDGYGIRPDAEEDADAVKVGQAIAQALYEGTAPSGLGIRIKALSRESSERALRTLDLTLTALAQASDGDLPKRFVVTLPKVSHSEQVAALANALNYLEQLLGFVPGAIGIELMVETPQAIIAPGGSLALPQLVRAGQSRVRAVHFGTYDFTASLGIIAEHQHMQHPNCLLALGLMQLSLAGTGVEISDGATTTLPIPPHKFSPTLGEAERRANHEVVSQAWKLHFDNITQALTRGIYQGWDLHPGQLIARYVAVYAFFLGSFEATKERLRHFLDAAAQATRVGTTFDDAATGQGLLNTVLRAVDCGAVPPEGLMGLGVSETTLRTRSFRYLLEARRYQPR